MPCQDNLPLRLVFLWFNPGGTAINFLQDHLLFVATSLPVGELTRLVCLHCPLGLIYSDEDIMLLILWQPLCYWMV